MLDIGYGDGTVRVVSSNPVNMIDWSDMQPADIIAVGGTGIASTIIKLGTWSISSHTALYEGGNYVIESLFNGPTRRTKEEFLSPSENVNIMLVKRHYNISISSARDVVRAAADNVGYGIGPYGKHPLYYNWGGLPSGGMSTTSGQMINATTNSIIPGGVFNALSNLNEINNLLRNGANAIPEGAEVTNPNLGIAKRLFGGPKGRIYCSEAVITWYNTAGIPITYLPPDHVPPKLIAEDYFKGTLYEIGYLRYMV